MEQYKVPWKVLKEKTDVDHHLIVTDRIQNCMVIITLNISKHLVSFDSFTYFA